MTTKQQKAAEIKQEELSIDLNKMWTPSELITNAYKEANAMDLFFADRSEFVNERRIWDASRASDPPAAIKHNIFSLYRKVVGSKEYLLFHETLYTTDYFKNGVDWTRYLGVVTVPKIVRRRSINPATIKSNTDRVSPSDGPPEVESNEDVYLWPFEQVKKQIRSWREQGVIPQTAKFIAWVPPNKYSVINFEDFLELEIEDLVLINKMGSKLTGLYKPGDPAILQTLKAMMKDAVKEQLAK